MSKIRFTHDMIVPNQKSRIEGAAGYADEMEDVKVFTLSQKEYDELRREGGLFDLFDCTFGTIIDDCEEDGLSYNQVAQALEMTKQFKDKQTSINTSGLDKVIQSLEYARQIGGFLGDCKWCGIV